MSFGLTKATFQDLMNDIFKSFLRKFVLVFFNDILVYSMSKEEYLVHLTVVLKLLEYNYLYDKRSKWKFAVEEIDSLGHVINAQAVRANSSKVSGMLE